ncbi:hypothetical protein [Roseiflexus sp. RS-1]|jgi:hypothetical protein|uniref:hypothetical protein n=1 Tax=Roseiflexus sp. (strain RS-1) TaxID=357808 RepID=UPI0000D7FB7B|nr:hypothetical protein [Roseiflexus sp. RS-1]ABQ90108.1 hypothetical protein RoseRS_1718 [Roseiflexus sp. RS-1]
MASATNPSHSEPGAAGTDDAAAVRYAPPRFNLILDAVMVIAVAITSFVFLNRPLDTQHLVIIGASDRGIATGFHGAEISQADGRPFRWTTAEATVRLPAHGVTDHLLMLRLAAPTGVAPSMPQAVAVDLNRTHLATLPVLPAPRVYRLLAPHHRIAIAGNDITLRTATTRVPGDRRDLGVVAFAVTCAALNETAWLPSVQAAAVTGAAWALLIALRSSGIGALRWIVVALFTLISLSMRHSDLRFAHRWEALLLTLGLATVFALFLLITARWKGSEASVERSTFNAHHLAFPLITTGVATLLAVLLLAPLTPDPARFVPGPPGDNLEYVWKLQWFADAIAERRSPTFVPYLFYPTGYELAYSELTPAHTLLGLPLTLLAGSTLTYNVLIVISFVLTTLLTALLAERLGAGRLGAFAAGIGVGFCLWRYQHTLGQMNMIGTQWTVLALYGLEGFIRRRSSSDAALMGTGVALAAWSSWYYGPTLWLIMALWLLMRWPWKETRSLRTAGPAALTAPLVALALIAPYAQPTIQALRGGDTRHEYTSLLSLSARPLDYLTPSRYHATWGAWSAQIAPDTAGAQLVAPGFALLALAGVGAWRWRRSPITWTLLIIAGVCFVLSLGPELRLGDRTIPLPALLAYEHIPVLRSIRAWSRMAFYVQICVGLLAALGLTGFAQWRRAWQALGVVAVCGVLLEVAHAAPWSASTAPRPVDRWLATQPGSGATLQVPDSFSGAIEYYALFSKRPSLTGYGTFEPAGATADLVWLREFPSERALTTLRRLGGEYILVRRNAMDRERPGWRERATQQPELAQVYEDDEFTVYRIVTGPHP